MKEDNLLAPFLSRLKRIEIKTFKNEPDGLLEIKWETHISDLKDMKYVEEAEGSPDTKYYTSEKYVLPIGEVECKGIRYAFYKGKFESVEIYVDNYENYEALRKGLFGRFGKGERKELEQLKAQRKEELEGELEDLKRQEEAVETGQDDRLIDVDDFRNHSSDDSRDYLSDDFGVYSSDDLDDPDYLENWYLDDISGESPQEILWGEILGEIQERMDEIEEDLNEIENIERWIWEGEITTIVLDYYGEETGLLLIYSTKIRKLREKEEIPLTPIEKKLYSELEKELESKKMEVQVYRQLQTGSYRLDLAIPGLKIDVECDGQEYHDGKVDKRRDQYLKKAGWKILRFTGSEINSETAYCIRLIKEAILSRSEISEEKPDDKQKEAINHGEGPCLVTAPPGSGKTKVLIARLKRLLNKDVDPMKVLAVVFNKAAAWELKKRLKKPPESIESEIVDKMWVGTFHSIGKRILEEEAGRHYDKDHIISRGFKRRNVFKNILDEMRKQKRDDSFLPDAQVASELVADINKTTKEDIDKEFLEEWKKFDSTTAEISLEIYKRYEDYKKKNECIDFEDMLRKPYFLLKKDRVIRDEWAERFEYILVDEFQDVEEIQWELLRLLAEPTNNLFCVADEDQLIYSWRGADIKRILNFPYAFPQEVHHITLEYNYRCPPEIVDASNKLIDNNKNRFPKTIKAGRAETPDSIQNNPIKLIKGDDEIEIANLVAEKIKKLVRPESEYRGKDIIILYRTNKCSEAFERSFFSSKIPFRIVGRRGFYSSKEVRIIIDYLRIICKPDELESFESFWKIINVPNRYIMKKMIEELRSQVKGKRLKGITSSEIPSNWEDWRREIMIKFIDQLKSFSKDDSLSELVKKIRRGFALDEYYQKSDELTGRVDNIRLENLNKLEEVIKEFKNFDEFEKYIKELRECVDKKEGVALSTIHKIKGMEYPIVFLADLDEGILPHSKSTSPEEMEEERRLCYVAITRTKESLYLCYNPLNQSRFIKEMYYPFLPEDMSMWLSL